MRNSDSARVYVENYTKEQLSPILTREITDKNVWADRWTSADRWTAWLCHTGASELFNLVGAREIRLFAVSQPDPGFTYEVAMGSIYGNLKRPTDSPLFLALKIWLKEQMDAGRVHVGILVLDEK